MIVGRKEIALAVEEVFSDAVDIVDHLLAIGKWCSQHDTPEMKVALSVRDGIAISLRHLLQLLEVIGLRHIFERQRCCSTKLQH